MKAVVFQGAGDIRLEEVPDPQIKNPFDAIVRITMSAICGTCTIRGTLLQVIPFRGVMDAYNRFNERRPGWTKVSMSVPE